MKILNKNSQIKDKEKGVIGTRKNSKKCSSSNLFLHHQTPSPAPFFDLNRK